MMILNDHVIVKKFDLIFTDIMYTNIDTMHMHMTTISCLSISFIFLIPNIIQNTEK